jgi:uncharacterized iron-regulated protein
MQKRLAIIRTDAGPDARRLHHDFRAGLHQVFLIAGGFHVHLDRVRDIGVDVILRRPRREVGRAFVAGDGAPRVQRPCWCDIWRARSRAFGRPA